MSADLPWQRQYFVRLSSNHNVLPLHTQKDCIFQDPSSSWGLVRIPLVDAVRGEVMCDTFRPSPQTS